MIKRGFLFWILILSFSIGIPIIAEAKVVPTLQSYRVEDQIIKGKADVNEQLYLYIKGVLHSVRTDNNGDFSLKLSDAIGSSNVTIFVKDEWGYDESQVTYSPKNIPSPVEEKENITVTYIGLTADDEYYLTTAADATIYALYEGKTYSGQFGVAIPKGTSTEIKAYAKRNNGVNGETVLLSMKSTRSIQLNPYDFKNRKISGHAWPYALLELKDDTGWTGFTVAGEDGTFTNDRIFSVSELQEQHTISVESPYVPIKSASTMIVDKYKPTEEIPFYLTVDTVHQEIDGMTFAETEIRVDGKKCTTSDKSERFTCPILNKNEPIREIEFLRDGHSIGKTLVELDSTIEEFPFQLERPVTSEYPILSGKTLPNRQFIVTYGVMTLPLSSDSKGTFSLAFPKQYTGEFSVALRSLNNQMYDMKSWTILDERLLLKPEISTSNGFMVLTNRMKGLPEMTGEVLIEHEDGNMDIQQFTFPKQEYLDKEQTVFIEGVKPNDRYYLMLKTREEKPREARFEGVLHPIVELKLDSFGLYDQQLTGTGEPGTHVRLEVPLVFTNSTIRQTSIFEGDVTESGAFILKRQYSDTSKSRAIDYTGWIQVKITRPNLSDQLSYHIPLQDESRPNLKINKILDSGSYFTFRSDDRLTGVETRYYQQEKLVKTNKTDFGWNAYYEVVWDKEKRTTFKQANITRIEMRGINNSGLISDWISVPVLSTKIPLLTANEILYGDKELRAKTSPNVNVKAIVGNTTYEKQSDKSGLVVFKLKKPVANVSNSVTFVTKSEAGTTKNVYKSPIGFPVKDVILNDKKDKLWFVTQDLRLPIKRYELKLNGTPIQLEAKNSSLYSVYPLPKAWKTPLKLELTLRNTDGTVKSTFRKTIKTTYQNKKVSSVVTSTKARTIQGIAQPYHQIVINDENNSNLAYVALYQEGNFKVKAYHPLKIGKKIIVYSKDPFGQKSSTKITIRDDIPPKTPTISKVTTRSAVITGKTEAKVNVLIKFKKKSHWVKADTKGNYRLKISSLKAGETIIVYAKDDAGNQSKIVKVHVMK